MARRGCSIPVLYMVWQRFTRSSVPRCWAATYEVGGASRRESLHHDAASLGWNWELMALELPCFECKLSTASPDALTASRSAVSIALLSHVTSLNQLSYFTMVTKEETFDFSITRTYPSPPLTNISNFPLACLPTQPP
ncbi:hypothetical protein BKA65DRAFT_171842 [Rhexocercosporidium sp. MPI-PUGE-AT-0058]|nr:hypothetical protein BKA65DRAFT_171842 [Rhexocercosporidium sp. MPI-PUGE-AT-0058]